MDEKKSKENIKSMAEEDMGKDKVFIDYNQYLEKLNSYSVSDCNLILRKILGVSESSVLDTEYIEYNEFAIGVLELVKCHYTDIVSYEIPEFIDGKKVTKIKYSAFEDCEKLARITLPNSITHIGDMAFKNCVSLESINIPNKVRNIYRGTFENCTSLAQVTFSQSLKIIEPRAFYGCSSLTQINLPYYLTKVSVLAFGKCTSLQKVIFESSLEHVGESAFECCSALTEVIFRGENVKTLYDCAFSGCSALEHFTIPASVTFIGMWTFSGCNCLKTIHNHSKLELDRKELGIGEITLMDIAKELEKPARDPREEMPKPILRTDVLEMKDLKPGMILKGTVRNVIDFGAFVDIGVHQDGLVHISQMTDRFIKHPLEAVSVGDVVEVQIMNVDLQKKRIALTMKIGK